MQPELIRAPGWRAAARPERLSRLRRIELTVGDLPRMAAFYAEALGFTADAPAPGDEALVGLYGAGPFEQVTLRRGRQSLVLQRFAAPGRPYPAAARACDAAFQHLALPTPDIHAAFARLPPLVPISRGGPQRLPARSGGATAFKFRDPEGHPLELIQFPDRAEGGIDHSAIVAASTERSIAFYRDHLGLGLAAQQVNEGPAQDRLDGLPDAVVTVVALRPAQPTPHVELLAYRNPGVAAAPPHRPNDLVATRLVFEAEVAAPALLADPDGHLVVLVPAEAGGGAPEETDISAR